MKMTVRNCITRNICRIHIGERREKKESQDHLIQGWGIPRDVERTGFSMWKGKIVKRKQED